MKNMVMILLLMVMADITIAQSPYLSVKVEMDYDAVKESSYLIEMKFCEPKQRTKKDDWFSADTSAIDFESLTKEDVVNNKFFKNGQGIEVLSGDLKFAKYNAFNYGNQVFAWEKIIVLRITDSADVKKKNPMYLVIPVVYKAFVTSIALTDLPFNPGDVLFVSKMDAAYTAKSRLSMTCRDIWNCSTGYYADEILEWVKE